MATRDLVTLVPADWPRHFAPHGPSSTFSGECGGHGCLPRKPQHCSQGWGTGGDRLAKGMAGGRPRLKGQASVMGCEAPHPAYTPPPPPRPAWPGRPPGLSQALLVPWHPPTPRAKHLPRPATPPPRLPLLAALPLPLLGCSWWTVARPSPGAGPHGRVPSQRVRQAWAGAGRTIGPSAAAFPGGAPWLLPPPAGSSPAATAPAGAAAARVPGHRRTCPQPPFSCCSTFTGRAFPLAVIHAASWRGCSRSRWILPQSSAP